MITDCNNFGDSLTFPKLGKALHLSQITGKLHFNLQCKSSFASRAASLILFVVDYLVKHVCHDCLL